QDLPWRETQEPVLGEFAATVCGRGDEGVDEHDRREDAQHGDDGVVECLYSRRVTGRRSAHVRDGVVNPLRIQGPDGDGGQQDDGDQGPRHLMWTAPNIEGT